MKISIHNFKAIGSILDYEIKPLTILSGNNSSGKSSFLQIFLLLKQTLEIDSTKLPLFIQGKYYSAKSYIDLINGKDISKNLEVSFSIDKWEFEKYGDNIVKSIFDSFPNYTCKLDLTYSFNGVSLIINKFVLTYTSDGKNNYVKFVRRKEGNQCIIESNNEYFIRSNFDDIPPKFTNIFYSAFFPYSYEVVRYKAIDNPKKGEPQLIDEIKGNEFTNLDSVKSYFENFFNEMYYIGPLRIEPKDSYPASTEINFVGIKGENTAQILESRHNEAIEVYLPVFEDDLIRYELKNTTLIEATNFWMCDVFKFGTKLYSKDVGESYTIILVNYSGVEISIKHVGFGISQILPIIVQGLLMNKGGTLILEQPEIHLHPKIQSWLFDFIHSLIIQDKNVIIETHSDHFITRMRRRVAEDENSILNNKIKLTFIEQGEGDLIFKSININELGTYNVFPEDFIESPEKELKALLNAQIKKRISKRVGK